MNDSSPPGSLQVFVATHSSQFLDLTLDRKNITVFRCAAQLNEDGGSERDTNIRVSRVGDDARCILADLGMRNSAVLLCNCTIWVEGITDRMYLRHWLDLYWQSSNQSRDRHRYLEDVHFAFIEQRSQYHALVNSWTEPTNPREWTRRLFVASYF